MLPRRMSWAKIRYSTRLRSPLIPPEECTVFEDITTGIGGAKKGGFSTCAIFDETNADETDALKQLSDHYITGWEELL